jgi:hypothetical protein
LIPRTPITDGDLAHLEQLALAASQEDWQVGHTATKTLEEAVAWMAETIAKRDNPDLWMVGFGGERKYDGDQEYIDGMMCVSYTGNGPTSEANADYIAACKPANVLALIRELRRWRSIGGGRHA